MDIQTNDSFSQSLKACIFDLDGTLLDTLSDLVDLTNKVLTEYGWPQCTREEILSYAGSGGKVLIERAAPPDTPDSSLEEAYQYWQDLYPEYGHKNTKPFDGIPDMLADLKARGLELAVLSNKFDEAVRSVVAEHFPGLFTVSRGASPTVPRKPDPRGLQIVLDDLGLSCDQAIYIGDTATDMETTRKVGMIPVAAKWGYGTPEADISLEHPSQLVPALFGQFH